MERKVTKIWWLTTPVRYVLKDHMRKNTTKLKIKQDPVSPANGTASPRENGLDKLAPKKDHIGPHRYYDILIGSLLELLSQISLPE